MKHRIHVAGRFGRVLAGVAAVLALVVPLFAGQAGRQGATGRGQAPSDLRTVNNTVYTNKTELFVTFRPTFIVGEATRIGAHLSKLGTRFLPYSDNTVAITLAVSGVDTKTKW